MIRDALSSRSWVLPDNCLRPQMSNGVTLQSQQHQFSFNSELEDKDTQLTTSAGQRSSRRPIGPIVLVSPTSTLTDERNHASCQTSARWDEKLEMRMRRRGPPVGGAHDDFHKSEQWHHLPERRLEPMSISTFEIRTWMQSQPHQRFCFKILNWKHLQPLELTCHDV